MADKGEVAPLELRPLFEIIVGTARIIGSAVLNPPGRDASGRAEKRMTAAWLVAWAGFNRRKWIERQCRGSTHKGEMLVGQHGEETADGIHWKRMGTSLLMTKKSFGCYKSWQLVKLTVAEERVVLALGKYVH